MKVSAIRTTVRTLPLSSLDILVRLECRSREPVATDAPEVDGEEKGRHQRDEDAVQDVEAQERVRTDLATTEQEGARVVDVVEPRDQLVARPLVPQHRRGATHVRADGPRP